MRALIGIAVVACVGALSLVAAPAVVAHASSKITIDVTGTPAGGYDFIKGCNGPGDCFTRAGNVNLEFSVSNLNQPITISYKTVDGTALAGRDYVATSGSVTIQPNLPFAALNIPLIINGDPPGTQLDFTAEVTGTSLPATISGSPAPEVIYNGGNWPWGCNLSEPDASTVSAACTGQPAGLQWNISVECRIFRGFVNSYNGNTVTGDGTSTASCPTGQQLLGEGYIVS